MGLCAGACPPPSRNAYQRLVRPTSRAACPPAARPIRVAQRRGSGTDRSLPSCCAHAVCTAARCAARCGDGEMGGLHASLRAWCGDQPRLIHANAAAFARLSFSHHPFGFEEGRRLEEGWRLEAHRLHRRGTRQRRRHGTPGQQPPLLCTTAIFVLRSTTLAATDAALQQMTV